MEDQLKSFIKGIKAERRIVSFDEAAVKQAIVLPLLQLLGWNTHNIDEVTPEFLIENRRVDYALRLNDSNEVFLEVKKPGLELEKYQEQLLDYSFRQGVELAVLTNGVTWWLYLPMKKGDWKARKFYTIDIIQQEATDVTQKFAHLLSKDKVNSSDAMKNAEIIYKGRLKKETVEKTLPEAWNKIIREPNSLLLDLIEEITERICGFKPDDSDIKKFISTYEERFLIVPKKQPKPPRPEPPSPPGIKISRNALVSSIVQVLRRHNGRALKKDVEQEIYKIFKEKFEDPYYIETVSGGVPRWKNNIAWAKERAKLQGLVKRPADSGRGYWELTELGISMDL